MMESRFVFPFSFTVPSFPKLFLLCASEPGEKWFGCCISFNSEANLQHAHTYAVCTSTVSSSYGEAALNISDIKTTDSEVRNTEHLVIKRSARKSGGPLAFMWMLPPNLHVVADQVPPHHHHMQISHLLSAEQCTTPQCKSCWGKPQVTQVVNLTFKCNKTPKWLRVRHTRIRHPTPKTHRTRCQSSSARQHTTPTNYIRQFNMIKN